MKIFYYSFISFYLVFHSFTVYANELLINDINKQNKDYYLLSSSGVISSELHCNKPYQIFFMDNYSVLNNIRSFEYKPVIERIKSIPDKTSINLNLEGSENYADISGNISFKSRYYALKSDLRFNILDNYNHNGDSFFQTNEMQFNRFSINNLFTIFDKSRYLRISANNYFGNTHFPSIYQKNSIYSRNNQQYGNYSLSFGSDYTAFSVNGELNYIKYSEKAIISEEDIKYYPDYHNLNFLLSSTFYLSDNLKSDIYVNYSESGLVNFLYPEIFPGRIDAERLTAGFEAQYALSESVSIGLAGKLSTINLSQNYELYFDKLLLDYNLNLNFKLNKSSNAALYFESKQYPELQSITNGNKISGLCAGGEYKVIYNNLFLKAKIYYGYYDGSENLSAVMEGFNSESNSNFGLSLSGDYNTKFADIFIFYRFNDYTEREILFINLFAGHNFYASVSKSYDNGINWKISGKYRKGYELFNPEDRNFLTADEYFILNIKAGYLVFSNIELYIKMNNLNNAEFYHDYYLPSHSRMILGGVSVDF